METVLILALIIGVLIWYGFFAVFGEAMHTSRKIAKRNLDRLDAMSVKVNSEKWIELGEDLNEEKITKAAEAKAKIHALMSD